MTRNMRRRPPITIWAATFGVFAISLPVSGQEEEAGDQLFRFGFGQTFSGTDNIRLDDTSIGTTYYSDTRLSFDFSNESGPDALTFSLGGVGRIVDDPVIGTDSGFRDPRADLSYIREGANGRFSLLASYYKPDLAFLDPLQQEDIDAQDIFRGGGTREDYFAGARLETGLEGPIGFVFDLNSRKRSYSDTTDPLLFSNETHYAAVGTVFRLSGVTQGRLDWSEERYRAGDVTSTDRDTRRLTLGLDHDLSEIATISLEVGHSQVVETFDALPGVENKTSGPVGVLSFERQMQDGRFTASLDTTLTNRGRQTTLEAGRVIELPTGGLEFSIGAARGDSFDPRPIGRIAYFTESPRARFDIGLSRTTRISDVLLQATETTRLDMGYEYDLTQVSSFALDLYYADVSLAGDNSSGAGRERASLYASYSHNVTEDWDFVVGYEFRYFSPDIGESAKSNGLFFALQRDFDIFR